MKPIDVWCSVFGCKASAKTEIPATPPHGWGRTNDGRPACPEHMAKCEWCGEETAVRTIYPVLSVLTCQHCEPNVSEVIQRSLETSSEVIRRSVDACPGRDGAHLCSVCGKAATKFGELRWFCDSHFPVKEMVEHPNHYTQGKYEVWDVLDDWFPHDPIEWNVVKYVARAKHKGKQIQDLKKALAYLKRRIAQLEGGK